MRAYWGRGRARGRLLGSLVISFTLFKLSAFQRYHARERVFPAAPPVFAERQPVAERESRIREIA